MQRGLAHVAVVKKQMQPENGTNDATEFFVQMLDDILLDLLHNNL